MLKEWIKKFIPGFLISRYHFLLAFFGAFFYGFPSRKLKVVGITGTSGKSTVVDLTARILEEAGYQVASLSSIRFKIREKERKNTLKMTMPGRFFIQKFLREGLKAGCQYAVLEITSEGISQHRHCFIGFDAAALTNLSPEHIEAHKGFENYRKAKSELFKITKNVHIINLDDENAEYFLGFPAEKKYGYTMNNEQRTTNNKNLFIVYCSLFAETENGVTFKVQNTKFDLKLLGSFNVYNALAAISVGLSQGVSLEICKKALEKVKGIPGRMEEVIEKPFKVIVDYAITPVALEKVYQTLIANHKAPNNKLICILGACGGGRDKWKRPVLGKIAAQYCQEIIITNEDPYDEDPNQILLMIKSGIFNSQFSISNFYEILDRREAIRKALQLAKPNDTIIITGKGCEPWICGAGGKKIPWDDREIVKEEFNRLNLPKP